MSAANDGTCKQQAGRGLREVFPAGARYNAAPAKDLMSLDIGCCGFRNIGDVTAPPIFQSLSRILEAR